MKVSHTMSSRNPRRIGNLRVGKLLARALIGGGVLLAPIGVAASLSLVATPAYAFKLEYLKSDQCKLGKVPVNDPELRCIDFVKAVRSSCAEAGGTTVETKDRLTCDTPRRPKYTPAGPGKLGGKQDGSPGPFDAGSQSEARVGIPPKGGCVLRPGNPCDKTK